jgi:hypothetical protein
VGKSAIAIARSYLRALPSCWMMIFNYEIGS